MNFILAYIIEFFGLGKREWHYSHNTPSQHILQYLKSKDPDPYKPSPLLTGGYNTIDDIANWHYGLDISRGYPFIPRDDDR